MSSTNNSDPFSEKQFDEFHFGILEDCYVPEIDWDIPFTTPTEQIVATSPAPAKEIVSTSPQKSDYNLDDLIAMCFSDISLDNSNKVSTVGNSPLCSSSSTLNPLNQSTNQPSEKVSRKETLKSRSLKTIKGRHLSKSKCIKPTPAKQFLKTYKIPKCTSNSKSLQMKSPLADIEEHCKNKKNNFSVKEIPDTSRIIPKNWTVDKKPESKQKFTVTNPKMQTGSKKPVPKQDSSMIHPKMQTGSTKLSKKPILKQDSSMEHPKMRTVFTKPVSKQDSSSRILLRPDKIRTASKISATKLNSVVKIPEPLPPKPVPRNETSVPKTPEPLTVLSKPVPRIKISATKSLEQRVPRIETPVTKSPGKLIVKIPLHLVTVPKSTPKQLTVSPKPVPRIETTISKNNEPLPRKTLPTSVSKTHEKLSRKPVPRIETSVFKTPEKLSPKPSKTKTKNQVPQRPVPRMETLVTKTPEIQTVPPKSPPKIESLAKSPERLVVKIPLHKSEFQTPATTQTVKQKTLDKFQFKIPEIPKKAVHNQKQNSEAAIHTPVITEDKYKDDILYIDIDESDIEDI